MSAIHFHSISHTDNTKILTGATGSIGAHTLFELLRDDSVSIIFCLTRRTSPWEAILHNLLDRELYITPGQASKIVALNSALDQPNLGLQDTLIRRMQASVTQIIHAAWPVNFNLPVTQFEPHICGLHNLIQFSLSVHRPEPATVMFCSSVSTVLNSSSTTITEAPVALDSAYMGYGQSKLIGEHIISAASKVGARAYSLRIGQVSGHSKKALWNDTEALPLLIRSALTLHALPDLDQTCSWLPVDKLASAIVDLAKACSASSPPAPPTVDTDTNMCIAGSGTAVRKPDDTIYNICSSREFTWSALLSTLSDNGFQFETVPVHQWLQMLRESEARGEEHINPAVKLIAHYEAMYGGKSGGLRLGQKTFVTEKAERDSVTLRNGRMRIIEDGILSCYMRDWVRRWMSG